MTAALYPDSSGYMSEDSGVRSCKLVDQPNLLYTYLQLMAVFGSGICASTWVWTSNSLASWKRFIVRHIRPDLNEPIRLKRHEMISKVFGRRHQLSQVWSLTQSLTQSCSPCLTSYPITGRLLSELPLGSLRPGGYESEFGC